MSSLTISITETDLQLLAVRRPRRDSKRIFGAPGLRVGRNAQALAASAASSRGS